MKWICHRFGRGFLRGLAFLALAVSASAQSTTVQSTASSEAVSTAQAKPKTGIRRPTPTSNRVVVAARSETDAPQVVTVVHQLSGIKVLRLLLRQAGDRDVIATMNEPLAMTTDVHMNIIAGLVFDDGQTIAVWLPQAAAEIEPGFMLPPPLGETPEMQASTVATTASSPNLSVVFGDGKRLHVSFVGFDGTTGVSVLRVTAGGLGQRGQEAGGKLVEGQRVRLFAPQRAEAPANVAAGTIYVRVGETDAKLAAIHRTSAGKVERLTATSVNLSPEFVGGVAMDESGATLGLVESIDGNQARILPVSAVDAAVHRVLERQASVPRPLLGVQAEAVELTSRGSFLAQGWREQDVSNLFEKRSGIVLTSVLPGTPAALANLRPGDVIVRVNEGEVKTVEDFSSLLGEAGSGTAVHFTVIRPSQPTPESLEVKLGGSLDAVFEKQYFTFRTFAPMTEGPLARLGIETVAVSAKFSPTIGALGGLLVVAVQPQSVAARGGVREGDVIQSIDGRPAVRAVVAPFAVGREKKHALVLVRDRQRMPIVLEPESEKEP